MRPWWAGWWGVYFGDLNLIAAFPTRAAAEKYAMPADFADFERRQELIMATGRASVVRIKKIKEGE